MHFRHLEHQSTHYHFTGHPLSTLQNAGAMYSLPLVLFLKTKRKKKKEKTCFFFNFHWLSQPAEKKRISWRTIFFSAGCFFFFFLLKYPAPPFYHPWRGHRTMKGLFCIPVGLCFGIGYVQSNHALNTGRDSVDSPSGCKVKTLMYSTFANELVCLRNCFLFQLSFNRFTTVVCLYNVTFLYFYVWGKIHRGQEPFEFQLENIWDI